jgi:hypothetical protein
MIDKRQSSKDASIDILEFLQKRCLSRKAHSLHPRREWASSVDLHLRVPVGNPALMRRWKKEEDPHLHTDETKPQKAKA